MARPGVKRARRVFQGSTGQCGLFPSVAEDHGGSQPAERGIELRGFATENPEASYIKLSSEDHRRRFGQFFTPTEIAALMTEWIAAIAPDEVLDPAIGTGVFARAVKAVCPKARVVGIDADALILSAARAALHGFDGVELETADFLNWRPNRRFKAIIANPPYLKHHNFSYEDDIFQEIGRRNSISISRLSNIYALFVFEICRRLESGGRAAIVIPGEWVNANFGEVLKRFLVDRGYLKVLFYFSHDSLVFDDALTTASILLVENSGCPAHITTAYIHENVPIAELAAFQTKGECNHAGIICRRFTPQALVPTKKWDQLLKGAATERPAGFAPLSQIAQTRRGIATGANNFFLISDQAARQARIRESSLVPCIGKARDVDGLRFSNADYDWLTGDGRSCRLVNLTESLTKRERAYIAKGEESELHSRFLLAARKPWYKMESREPAPILAAVFGRRDLRFIWNEARVHNLTAFHCVYPKGLEETQIKALVAALNSRVVQSRALQQQRVYGGGLRKFEPKDLLEIEVPRIWSCASTIVDRLALLLDDIDRSLRERGEIDERLQSQLDEAVMAAAEDASRDD